MESNGKHARQCAFCERVNEPNGTGLMGGSYEYDCECGAVYHYRPQVDNVQAGAPTQRMLTGIPVLDETCDDAIGLQPGELFVLPNTRNDRMPKTIVPSQRSVALTVDELNVVKTLVFLAEPITVVRRRVDETLEAWEARLTQVHSTLAGLRAKLTG